MKILLLSSILVYVVCIVESISPFASEIDQFDKFRNKYKKKYENKADEIKATWQFTKRLRKIIEHNKRFEREEVLSSMAVNAIADMTEEQIDAFTQGNRDEPMDLSQFDVRPKEVITLTPDMVAPGPESKNWKAENHTTGVKDQGYECNSCYAFSAIAALESHLSIKYGSLTSLSEQFLIDCNKNALTGNWGCQGGSPGAAYLGIKYAPGVPSMETYPYNGKENPCRYDSQTSAGLATGYVKTTYRNETFMKDIVGTIGPITAAMNPRTNSFIFYSSGIIDDPECVPGSAHSVLIVGYGTAKYKSGKTVDYWLCKNSWSEDWGDKGYFRMVRDKDMCGISRTINYPLV